MSLMTREDMLRELELLPVWQLKAPLPSLQAMHVQAPSPISVTETIREAQTLLSPTVEPVIEPAPPEIAFVEPIVSVAPFRLLISDDASIGFALDSISTSERDVETLLSNMLKAISINCSIDIAEASAEMLGTYAVKLLLVMGETAAHSLLGKFQTVADWRSTQASQPLSYQHLPVVVTYHPAFLLNNTAYKAQAWADLCTAKRILFQG